MGLLNDRINNKLEKCNLIDEHALNREPVPLTVSGKLPTYPFPKLTLTLTSHLGQNVGLGKVEMEPLPELFDLIVILLDKLYD